MLLPHIDGICLDGFSEPVSIAELRQVGYSSIPKTPGVYLIIHASHSAQRFLSQSTGGKFKGKEPNYPMSIVTANWVEGARVVYVGMTTARKGLRGRLRLFFDFGSGVAVAHRGGRLVWHLEDSGKMLVRWRICSVGEAVQAETAAIACFKALYGGRRPYANMNK